MLLWVVSFNYPLRDFLHNALSIYKKNVLIKYPFCEKIKSEEDRLWGNNRIKENKIYYDAELICNHYYTKNGATWK